jgi:hypothetical protein
MIGLRIGRVVFGPAASTDYTVLLANRKPGNGQGWLCVCRQFIQPQWRYCPRCGKATGPAANEREEGRSA